jgi:hypothetical protein|tara:strand:- start:10 stop:234 length:225 start_codon:yes stop_codon:yes gene_type:complete
MALIDKRLLVEECLTIILKIHKIRAPEKIKEENTDLLQRFNMYAQFMEKDLDELAKLSKELRAELGIYLLRHQR